MGQEGMRSPQRGAWVRFLRGWGGFETAREAAMAAREKAPDGAEPLIIQEGGEPTSKDDKPADTLGSGRAKERPRRPTADVSDPRNR